MYGNNNNINNGYQQQQNVIPIQANNQNNNSYQAQLQQGQMQNLQNQYNQQNVQKIQQQSEVKQTHIKQLAQQFQVNPAHPTDIMIGGPEREEMMVNITPLIVARMVIYNNYPEAKPRFFVQNKLEHQNIDNSTWEIIYIQLYQWDERRSNLLDLVKALQNKFQQAPPKKDPIILEVDNVKNYCYEEGQYESLLQCNLGEIFPNHQPEQWSQLLNYQSLDELIIQTKQYKELVQYIVQLMNACEMYSQQMTEKYQNILQKRQIVQQEALECDNKKTLLIKQFQQCQMIKERFDKTKVLQQLETEIDQIEQQQEEQQDIIDFNDNQQQKSEQFAIKLQQFYQQRKKYHEYKYKKQKLEEIL